MNHDRIRDEQIVDRYLLGNLPAEAREAFEEHYLDCEECLDALRVGDMFLRGVRQVALEGVARTRVATGILAKLASLSLNRQRGLLAACLVAFLALPTFLWVNHQRAVQELTQPQANTPMMILGVQRSVDATEPTYYFSLPSEPQWLFLGLELPDPSGSRYAVTIQARGGEAIWSSDSLVPDQTGQLTLSLHSSLLSPGTYEVRYRQAASEGTDSGLFLFGVR